MTNQRLKFILFVFLLIVFGCSSGNEELSDDFFDNVKKFDDSLYKTIIADSINLKFETVVSYQTVSNLFATSNLNSLDSNKIKILHEFVHNGRRTDYGELWSLKVDSKDSLKVINTLLLIDSLKLFPPNMKFIWSFKQSKSQSGFHELIVIYREFNLNEKILKGGDIVNISQHFNSEGYPILVLKFAKSKEKYLEEFTRYNIGLFVAITSNDKFYFYTLMNYEFHGDTWTLEKYQPPKQIQIP